MRPGQMVLVLVVGLGARTSSSWALALGLDLGACPLLSALNFLYLVWSSGRQTSHEFQSKHRIRILRNNNRGLLYKKIRF